jgi:hypothetical protein
MKIFGFEIRRASQPQQAKDAPPTQQKASTYGSNRLWVDQRSKLITALGGSSSVLDVLGDPRNKMLSFQAMVAAFPEVARMLRIHELIMGCPYIESEDEGFELEANALLREIRWREALKYEGNEKFGIDSFVGTLAKRVMVEGQQFYEITDAQGLPVLQSRQKIESIKLYNSQDFEYYEYTPTEYRLQYSNGLVLEMDKKITPAFQTIVIENMAEFPWGVIGGA